MLITSEGPVKITKATIESTRHRRQPGRRLIVRDQECRGLALILNATGIAWSYSYRPRGTDPKTTKQWPNQTVTIGNPAPHSPDDARIAANKLKGQLAAGTDPVAEKKARATSNGRSAAALSDV